MTESGKDIARSMRAGGAASGHARVTAAAESAANALATVLAALFFVILALVNAQIVFRFLLEISVPWTEDISRLLFVYLVYLGASAAFHERAMITIDTIPALAPRTADFFSFVATSLVFLIVSFMFFASIPMVSSSWNTSLPTVEWISNGWAYLAFTISFGLMLIHSLAQLCLWIMSRRASQ